jgi:hypothetical protein
MKDALTGKGMDRHLFALLDLAKKSGSGNIPKIFQDKAYSVINHNILSTSTLTSKVSWQRCSFPLPSIPLCFPLVLPVSSLFLFLFLVLVLVLVRLASFALRFNVFFLSQAIEGGGFGPVVEDGYGLGYGVESDFMGFNVTSYGRKTDEFVNHIKKAVIDIRDVLEGGKN